MRWGAMLSIVALAGCGNPSTPGTPAGQLTLTITGNGFVRMTPAPPDTNPPSRCAWSGSMPCSVSTAKLFLDPYGDAGYAFDHWASPDSNLPCAVTSGAADLSKGMSCQAVFVASSAAAPAVTGFAPPCGPVGTMVTIQGSALGGAAASVAFKDTRAASVSGDDASLTAAVPMGSATGAITVLTPSGLATSKTKFAVGCPADGGMPMDGSMPGDGSTASDGGEDMASAPDLAVPIDGGTTD